MTRARNLANLGNKNAITADIGLFNIGIGSTQPTSYKLEVVGGDAYIGGGVTITGNLSVGGTVTYEDVTNVDAVGIITANKGVRIVGGGLTCVGVSTFSDTTESNSASTGSVILAGGLGVAKNIYTSGGAYVQGSAGLNVSNDVSIADKIVHTGDTNTAIRFPAADTISAETGGSERLRIDSSGRVNIGNTSNRTVWGSQNQLQIEGLDGATSNAAIIRNSDNIYYPWLGFGKSRGTSDGSSTIVQDDDILGVISWNGADGNDMTSQAAAIYCEVDGTPGSDDMPGRLEFHTTADGAATSTERLRIDSSGRMGLGVIPTDYHSNNTAVFQLKDANAIFSRSGGTFLGMFQNIKYNSSDVTQYVTSNPGSAYFQASGTHKFYTAASGTADNNATLNERLRINDSGFVGINQSSPAAELDIKAASPEIRLTCSNAALGSGETVGQMGWYTTDTTTPGGAGTVSYINTFSATSNGSDYTTQINNREGAGGGSTYIKLGNALGAITFGTNSSGSGAERLRIDQSGLLLLGTTDTGFSTGYTNMTIGNASASNTGLTIAASPSNGYSRIHFADANSSSGRYAGWVAYQHDIDALKISTGNSGSARITINSSGDANSVGIITAKTFVPTEGQLSNRNLIINGAMQVAQRGTSHTGSGGYATLDRFYSTNQVINVDLITTQHSLTSSDTGPWEEGFRYSLHQAQGYQGSAGSGNAYVTMGQRIEAQYIAQSGWNYLSSSSYLTLSFWVRSTGAQTYYGFVKTKDGTEKMYPFSFAISANTWTKITKNIPGNSNLQFDTNRDEGLDLNISAYWGTDFTDAGTSLNTWANWNSSGRTPVFTSTWFETNGGSFEVTGVQLEVNSVSTPFEHLSYGDDLQKCMRYCEVMVKGNQKYLTNSVGYATDQLYAIIRFKVEKRAVPSLSHTTGTNYYQNWHNNTGTYFTGFTGASWPNEWASGIYTTSAVSAKEAGLLGSSNASAQLLFTAEL